MHAIKINGMIVANAPGASTQFEYQNLYKQDLRIRMSGQRIQSFSSK
jgi:hypothetical protein